MASANAYDFVYNLQSFGVYDVILPMILIFAIMYAILSKIQVFGKGNQRVNMVVALILSFLILLPEHGIVDRLNTYLPRFTFIIILVVTGLILLGLLGVNVEQGLSRWLFFIFLILSLAGLVIVNSDLIPQSYSLRYFLEDNAWTIGVIAAIIVVIALIVGVGEGTKGGRAYGDSIERFRGPLRDSTL